MDKSLERSGGDGRNGVMKMGVNDVMIKTPMRGGLDVL
jgi:hypothetical protein